MSPKLKFKPPYIIFFLLSHIVFGQIGINTTNPDPSSILEVFSESKGLLIPRVQLDSTTDVLTIASPTESLLIYNTNTLNDVTPGFYYWDGVWIKFDTVQGINDWALRGNTVLPEDFLGTINTESLKIRVGNTLRWEFTNDDTFIFSNNEIKIGNDTTTALGFGCMALGFDANASGAGATAIGRDTSASDIGATAIGNDSQATVINSTALGRSTIASGVRSLAIGYESQTSGTESVAIGRNAMGNGTRSITIGANAVTAFNESIAIGNLASTTKANQLRYGSITEIDQIAATVVNASDGRFKYEIRENVPGLEFINNLRPVTYKFDIEKLYHFLGEETLLSNKEDIRSGFIAQEVEAAAKKADYTFDGLVVPENIKKDNYKVSYQQFVVPLVQSVKELSKKVEQLEAKNSKLEALVDEIEILKKYMFELKNTQTQKLAKSSEFQD